MTYRRHCAQCGKRLPHRSHNARFCNRACYRAYQLAHADRSPTAKARRKRQLAQNYIEGVIDRETYEATLVLYREQDLI
jgi:hypothetical protein